MKYAVVRILGKQYKISEGQEILVDKLNSEEVDYNVLLYVDGDKLELGKPELDKVKIKFKLIDKTVKGEKIDVFKYKGKSRYRKHVGFRPQFSKVLIEKLN